MAEKQYEILNSLPTYGPMYVPISDNGEPFYFEGFVVRFYKTDGAEWVANFQPGSTDLKQIISFEKNKNLLIIACGTCYIMNPNETKPIEVFGVNDRVVLHDQTGLTIIEPDGTHWNTERISWDGLAEIKIEDNLVYGLAYNPMHDADEWVGFKYDLDAKTLTGGSFYEFENKKKWWKVWS